MLRAVEYVTAGIGVLLVNPWSISSWLLGRVLVSLQKDTAGTERLWRGTKGMDENRRRTAAGLEGKERKDNTE